MYLVFDIGGSNMRLSNSFDGKNFHDFQTFQTPQDFNKALEIVQKFIDKSGSNHTGKKCCICLPGVFDKSKNTLVSASNLPFWVGKPIRMKLEEVVGVKIVFVNDASLAGLGEAVVGAGSTFNIVGYITIGTGIGGVRVVSKKIDMSTYGFEPGYQIIDFDGSASGGDLLDLENMASGTGIKRRYSEAPEAIQNQDRWDEINKFLAIGLLNTIVHWSPEVLVLGGSVAQNSHISLEKISSEIKLRLKVFPILPELKKATLGDKSALYGGLHLLRTT